MVVISTGREFAVRNVHFGHSGEPGLTVTKVVELEEKLEHDCVIRMETRWAAKAIALKLKPAIYNLVVSYFIFYIRRYLFMVASILVLFLIQKRPKNHFNTFLLLKDLLTYTELGRHICQLNFRN